MSEAATDLSGRWAGIFNYPRGRESNTFEAMLRDNGGVLVGETTGRSDEITDHCAILVAWITGRHDGKSVAFVKSYDNSNRASYAVSYRGFVSDDGTEIAGTWDIPGVWSGTFIMVRAVASAALLERAAAEPVG